MSVIQRILPKEARTAAAIRRAARLIADANAVMVMAGSGMNADSGMPCYSKPVDFWKDYPMYKRMDVRFHEIFRLCRFQDESELAWGFYLDWYRRSKRIVPHEGFHWLQKWAAGKKHGMFVFTTNMDNQFQAAGFDPARIKQVHGALSNIQCIASCPASSVWPLDPLIRDLHVDRATMRVPMDRIPKCAACGRITRPNVLLPSEDNLWLTQEVWHPSRRYYDWQEQCHDDSFLQMVILEIGAGNTTPVVRMEAQVALLACNDKQARTRAHLIRINPVPNREEELETVDANIDLTALRAMRRIDDLLAKQQPREPKPPNQTAETTLSDDERRL